MTLGAAIVLLAAVVVCAGLCAYHLGALNAAAAMGPCRCICHTHKRRLKIMLRVKIGGVFPLSFLTDPPGTRLDTGDIAPRWGSTDPSVVVAEEDPEFPGTYRGRVVGAGLAEITLDEADADLDAGETRLLSARLAVEGVTPEAEAQSVSIIAGAVTYPPAAPPAEPPAPEPAPEPGS